MDRKTLPTFYHAHEREFITPFGLSQPGARVELKVYVILTTGEESGSAAMFVQRALSLPLAALRETFFATRCSRSWKVPLGRWRFSPGALKGRLYRNTGFGSALGERQPA